MCTLSWLAQAEGYTLAFNRDERLDRAPEQEPKVWTQGAMRYLAPTDGEAGGHWVLINELGLTIGLLNGYTQSPVQRTNWRSRGLLLRDLADAPHCDAIWQRLNSPDALIEYQPLVLFMREAGKAARILRWDGMHLKQEVGDGASPLSSSSLLPDEAQSYRRGLYDRTVSHPSEGQEDSTAAPRLLAFHTGLPESGADALTPCMQRDDAATRSLCLIQVSAEEVSLAYAPGRPDRTPLNAPLVLQRK